MVMTSAGAETSGVGEVTIISDTSTPLSSFSSPRIIVSISFICKDSIILNRAKERTNSPSEPSAKSALDSAMTLKKRSIVIGLNLPLPPRSNSLRYRVSSSSIISAS